MAEIPSDDLGGQGGGIYVNGPGVTMVNSTISGNTAHAAQPGGPESGSGGGIYVEHVGPWA